jgi:hypothetical protein
MNNEYVASLLRAVRVMVASGETREALAFIDALIYKAEAQSGE